MLDQAMLFDEFALICTYSAISMLSQIKFFWIFLMLMQLVVHSHNIFL